MQLVGVDESSPALMSGGGLEVIGEQAVMVIAATPASALPGHIHTHRPLSARILGRGRAAAR